MNTTLENITFPFQANFSMTNDTMGQGGQQRSDIERKLKIAGLVFITLSVLGTLGNAISFLALTKSKKLQNATTAFVVNLCVADFFTSVANLIVFFITEWNRNPVYCRWMPMFRYWVAGESVYLIMGITINRFICVVYPKIYRSMYKPKLLAIQIALTWLYSLGLVLLPIFEVWGKYGYNKHDALCTVLEHNGKSARSYFFISAFAFPTITFVICYPKIFWVTYNASKRVHKSSILNPTASSAVAEDGNKRKQNNAYRASDTELKLLKMMLVVVVVFIICYFPLAFIKSTKKEAEMPTFTLFSYLLGVLANVINPIIYIAMSAEYRKAYAELFQCKKIWPAWLTSSNVESSKYNTSIL